MMFQSYALFPHMSVEQNVAFGLKQDRLPKLEIRERVATMLDLVKMSDYARRKPHQLSGGQRQRVALARSLVKRPKLLLLDEPLGALDKKLREHTQFELISLQEKLGVTFIVVTHDQEEAMTLASRIGVMNHGEIVQAGTPSEIYEFPGSKFVADFVGSVNMFEGKLIEDEPDYVRIGSVELGATIHVSHGISTPPENPCTTRKTSSTAKLVLNAQPIEAIVNRPTAATNSQRSVSTRVKRPVRGIAITSAIR